jgi:hypothetical protein
LEKEQAVNILEFMVDVVYIATQLCLYSVKVAAAIHTDEQGCIPIKLCL